MIDVPNFDPFTPYASDIWVRMPPNGGLDSRNEYRAVVQIQNKRVLLPITPLCTEMVTVFDSSGVAVLNPKKRSKYGGWEYESFNASGNSVIFNLDSEFITQYEYTLVVEQNPIHSTNGIVIPIENIQGKLIAKASLWNEPVVYHEPQFGYARLTLDRKSLVYIPRNGYVGSDSFSYCVINNHGHYSKNYCVYIEIDSSYGDPVWQTQTF